MRYPFGILKKWTNIFRRKTTTTGLPYLYMVAAGATSTVTFGGNTNTQIRYMLSGVTSGFYTAPAGLTYTFQFHNTNPYTTQAILSIGPSSQGPIQYLKVDGTVIFDIR